MEQARIDEVLQPAGAEEDARREERVRRGFWKTARNAAGRVPFIEEVVAAYYCALDRKTPPRVRGTLFAALAYFVMPIDLIPDFVAVFGFTDDAAVLMAALTAVRRHVRPGHRQAASEAVRDWRE